MKLLKWIELFFYKNKNDIKKLLIIFFLGIIISVIFLNALNIEEKRSISDYINNYKENFKNIENQDFKKICINNVIKNSIFITIIFFSGFFIFGKIVVYIVNFLEGFIHGYTIAAVVGTLGFKEGISFSFSILLFQNLIQIPIILFISIVTLYMIKDIKSINNNEKIGKKIITYLIMFLFTECVNITSVLGNVYFSSKIIKILKLF